MLDYQAFNFSNNNLQSVKEQTMATVLISGANRGLGLEFSRQYAEAGWQVIAGCRKPAQAEALQALAQQHDTIEIVTLDVADFTCIDSLATQLAHRAIDVLINNAGIYGDNADNAFGQIDYAVWTQHLLVNSQAPVKMIEAFLAHLQQGTHKKVINISSLMGSIHDNTSGGSLFYRSSKATLNAAMKTVAIALQAHNIGVLILHPGWAKTDMGGINALISPAQSVSGMIEVIEQFTLVQTGLFLKYDGTAMPW
jgi:NAD(P)-dependent dehydrogenase (short-subunit alcohol dehydrogenase family)